MTTTARVETEFKVVGTRPVRHDGIEKVTGQALFGADIDLNGLLHGKVLRSPHAHARVVSVDTSRAESLPGVMAVITGDDLTPAGPMERGGGNRTGRHPRSGQGAVQRTSGRGCGGEQPSHRRGGG